jgi:hypothetical protein
LRVVDTVFDHEDMPVIVIDGPRESLYTLGFNGMYKPRNGNKLAVVLADLFNQAEQDPGVPKRSSLRGGLRIDTIHGKDGALRLQISRKGKVPSEKEWETVLKHLPVELNVSEPNRFEHQGSSYIRAELRR